MVEFKEIIIKIKFLLYIVGKKDLVGKKILISVGGMWEYLDFVRFIGNFFMGKMGIVLV